MTWSAGPMSEEIVKARVGNSKTFVGSSIIRVRVSFSTSFYRDLGIYSTSRT
jgi:hypothetical protein